VTEIYSVCPFESFAFPGPSLFYLLKKKKTCKLYFRHVKRQNKRVCRV
jgi:hypothetical protein